MDIRTEEEMKYTFTLPGREWKEDIIWLERNVGEHGKDWKIWVTYGEDFPDMYKKIEIRDPKKAVLAMLSLK